MTTTENATIAAKTAADAAAQAAESAAHAESAKDETEKLVREATALIAKAEQETDVTMARLLVCLESAAHWAEEMPKYAAREKRKGNGWAISSGALAALTGLAVWPLINEQTPPLVAAGLVSAIAFASAICALVLKVNRYTEMAERGQELAGLYGQALGLLLDLTVADGTIDQHKAHAAVAVFQQAKVRKDKLDRNPPRGGRGTPQRPDFAHSLKNARDMVAVAREQQSAAKASAADAVTR
ncbi:hypothetical protein [Microbacterium sulfonylureivorans]|uniref:hypothetical protein n=1 Tax=Microbacterium sulfonylureivorans TaxID=2486854 RepID=UPI000FD7C981|nr:hypothetical protein [Microbacterium sulfonylureivorans]